MMEAGSEGRDPAFAGMPVVAERVTCPSILRRKLPSSHEGARWWMRFVDRGEIILTRMFAVQGVEASTGGR